MNTCSNDAKSSTGQDNRNQLITPPPLVAAAGIIQPRAKGAVFWLMPTRIKLRAIGAMFTGKGPKAVVQPAVADPEEMGYSGFYATILSHVSHVVYGDVSHKGNMPDATHVWSHVLHVQTVRFVSSQNHCTGRCYHILPVPV